MMFPWPITVLQIAAWKGEKATYFLANCINDIGMMGQPEGNNKKVEKEMQNRIHSAFRRWAE